MANSLETRRKILRPIFRRIPLFLLLSLLLGGLATPAVHVVTYESGLEVVAKEHFTLALTVVSLGEVVSRANAPGAEADGNLQRLVRELERQTLIRKVPTRLDTLALLRLVPAGGAQVLQGRERPTYACVVSEWC
jgi:hypothetical protein